ncbi:MAG: nuclear transport factor 2 family protein [Spirochaetaceae bacterium]|nr:nuclear transport factor 2 family protein [Spirochaetaceae bacterium]
MKKLATIFAMLVLVLTACTGQELKQRNGTPPMTTEEKEVYAAYVVINNAMIEKDRTAMELYFDKNLTFTHMSGKKQTRKEFIGEIMDGTLNYFKVDTKDYSISVDGDTAHMKVTHTLTAKVYGISGSWTLGGENTYKKRGGIWVRVK